MAILKTFNERDTVPAAIGARNAGPVPASLTYGDFTSEYRAVLDELIALRLARSGLKGTDSMSSYMVQALMRIVYVGQQDRTSAERIRDMVSGSGRQRRDHSDWKPQAVPERNAGMLAGSSKLRRFG